MISWMTTSDVRPLPKHCKWLALRWHFSSQLDHSEHFTLQVSVHPFIHTLVHWQQWLPCRVSPAHQHWDNDYISSDHAHLSEAQPCLRTPTYKQPTVAPTTLQPLDNHATTWASWDQFFGFFFQIYSILAIHRDHQWHNSSIPVIFLASEMGWDESEWWGSKHKSAEEVWRCRGEWRRRTEIRPVSGAERARVARSGGSWSLLITPDSFIISTYWTHGEFTNCFPLWVGGSVQLCVYALSTLLSKCSLVRNS